MRYNIFNQDSKTMKSDNSCIQILDSQEQISPILKQNSLQQAVERRQGHWSTVEHKLYLDFLMKSKDLIESSQNNKGQRLFKKMSQVIGTRSPSQCRSHHQKFNPFVICQGKKRRISKMIAVKRQFPQPKFTMTSKQFIRKKFASQKHFESDCEEDLPLTNQDHLEIEKQLDP